ncbi:hypothetical protein C8A03DRAFT_11749 [Achaetomium macrosporum]|uniref:Uncharacterized protein n=1 Tax=Achaetomium macrosporum TaxID=79813 RepID=A0AAN7HIS3_9PEZI|nr:hypothetical protein C8A03DRAFT_11749 [Achaetomium macrosporum]
MSKPTESFLPLGLTDSGARPRFPRLTSESSSIISPLTLPPGAYGYFDHVATKGSAPTQLAPGIHTFPSGSGPRGPRGSQVYSPPSPGVRGPTVHPASFLSPHLISTTKEGQFQFDQQRLSNNTAIPRRTDNGMPSVEEPTVGDNSMNGLAAMTKASISPTGSALTGHPRSMSADPLNAGLHGQMNQRLLQQNARIREAWEAERKYLEANRERAEEVYKEERALMEDERAEWETEKATLLQEIERLQQLVLALGGGTVVTKNSLHHFNCGIRGGTGGLSSTGINSAASSQRLRQATQSGEPVLHDVSSSLPRHKTVELASPRSCTGPISLTPDFLKPTGEAQVQNGPAPVVDVHEIHPDLEGIRIKATSVKKATFRNSALSNGSRVPSQSGSSTKSEQVKSPQGKKKQTLQVLAADEADRLTMHAGHTPSHSLSELATVAASGTTTGTSSGGGSTPTMMQRNGVAAPVVAMADEANGASEASQTTEHFLTASDNHGRPLGGHPEPFFEAKEDRQLKGPLMVRNMPAHDEIFFQRLADKLEEVTKDDRAALPAVLQDPGLANDNGERALGQVKTHSERQSDSQQPAAGADDSGSAGSRSSPRSSDEDELDIPLKFRKRMNFGAPFGEIRPPVIRGH